MKKTGTNDPFLVENLYSSSSSDGEGGVYIDTCELGEATTLDQWVALRTGPPYYLDGCSLYRVRSVRHVERASRDAVEVIWQPGETDVPIRTIVLRVHGYVIGFFPWGYGTYMPTLDAIVDHMSNTVIELTSPVPTPS